MTENTKRAFARNLGRWGAPAMFVGLFIGGIIFNLEGDAAGVIAFFPAIMFDHACRTRATKGRWLGP